MHMHNVKALNVFKTPVWVHCIIKTETHVKLGRRCDSPRFRHVICRFVWIGHLWSIPHFPLVFNIYSIINKFKKLLSSEKRHVFRIDSRLDSSPCMGFQPNGEALQCIAIIEDDDTKLKY